MFHLNMYFQDASVLVLQPYRKNGKEVWKQYSYRSLFQRAFREYQYFFSKEDIVREFSKILNTDKFFFKGYYGVIDTKPRQFILNFSKKSSISYLKTQRLIEKSISVIISDRIDCIEAAQEESYDFYVSYKLNGKLIIEPVHHIVIREIKACHNLARIISAHCLPYIIDRSYDFGRPYNFTETEKIINL